jgi:DNA-binding MarR family transcriptional regulator
MKAVIVVSSRVVWWVARCRGGRRLVDGFEYVNILPLRFFRGCRDGARLVPPSPACHMLNQTTSNEMARMELANRLFFRLYQCANLMHKTGSRAVESEGLTTQQWAVLGALSRPESAAGMGVNELARYLMVSRQNLAGVIGRMERDGHICMETDEKDRRSRLIKMTDPGRHVWQEQALPKIEAYYAQALDEFSMGDIAHTLHYLLKLLDNMQRLDHGGSSESPGP